MVLLALLGFQFDLGSSRIFDARLSIVCPSIVRQLRSNIWANWYMSELYGAVSHMHNEYPYRQYEQHNQGWNPTASRQFMLQRSMCYLSILLGKLCNLT